MPSTAAPLAPSANLSSENPLEVRLAIDDLFARALDNLPDDVKAAVQNMLGQSGHKSFQNSGKSAFLPHSHASQLDKNFESLLKDSLDGVALQQVGHALHVYELLQSLGHSRALQNQFNTARISPRNPAGSVRESSAKGRTSLTAALNSEMVFVLTTHPTEVKSPDMMHAYNAVVDAFETGADDQTIADTISHLFAQSKNFPRKKVPAEELNDITPAIRNLLLSSAQNTREIADALEGPSGENIPNAFQKPFFSVTSWIGGDRDGNPNVTTAFANQCADRYEDEAIILLSEQLEAAVKLETNQDAISEIQACIGLLREKGYQSADELIAEIWNIRRSHHLSLKCKSQLKTAAIIANHSGLHFAKIQHRQDTGVMQRIFADMMGDWNNDYSIAYADLKDADKVTAIEKLVANKEELQNRFNQAKARLKDSDPVAYDMMLLFETIPSRPAAWDSLVMANAGFAADGTPIAAGRDIMETLALMSATGADDICKVIPLFESLGSLQTAGEAVRALLHTDMFKSHLQKHDWALCIMVALSDTTRQHGPGILAYQEKAIVDVALAILEYNHDVPENKKISLESFFGGALDNMRGGGDPTTRYFTLSRKVYAAAMDAGFEQKEISHLIGRRQLQTRQGRDVTSRLFNSVKNATVHVSEMVAGLMNFHSFMQTPKGRKNNNILDACRVELSGDEAFRTRVADKMIACYERGFHGFFDFMADHVTPWELVAGITIANRGISRDMTKKPEETKSRAITMQNAEHLMGQDKAGWFSLRMIADIPFDERRKLLKNSRAMQTVLVKGLQSMAKVDFESSWILAGIEKPNLLADAEQAKIWKKQIAALDQSFAKSIQENDESWRAEQAMHEILGPHATNQEKLTLLLLWTEDNYNATVQVVNETLLGDPTARLLSAQDALKYVNGRLSYEVADIEKTTRTARRGMARIWAAAKSSGADKPTETPLGQAALKWAQAVFDGSASPTSLIMPGYKPETEWALHDQVSHLVKAGVEAGMKFVHGSRKNGHGSAPIPV